MNLVEIATSSSSIPDLEEAQRQLTVCNSCRYCEDYCAVFPALELRDSFQLGDISYLANLCHDCRACYQACMYTEPHEFAINLPKLLTEQRRESYERHSHPRWLRRVFESGPLVLGLVTLAVAVGIVVLYAVFGSLSELTTPRSGKGSFYEVVSHEAMAVPGILFALYGLVVGGLGLRSFWRETGGQPRELLDLRDWRTAMGDVARLRWMEGSGDDCYYPDDAVPSPVRRWAHQCTMYGFLATFAATISAFIAEWAFHNQPPYSWLSVPVVLGLGGGIVMLVGTIAMLVQKRTANRALTTPDAVASDLTFIWSLIIVAATGILLLVLRDTAALGPALLVHLGAVLVLYVTVPYGKFVHAVYRLGALVRFAREERLGA